MTSFWKVVARWLLGSFMTYAGYSHLTTKRQEFRAQVPKSVPLDADTVVLASGVVEIGLGLSLLALPPGRPRRAGGELLAAFYVAIFPGNIAQFIHRRNAFGLDTDRKRFIRLFFQPLLVLWALWSTREDK